MQIAKDLRLEVWAATQERTRVNSLVLGSSLMAVLAVRGAAEMSRLLLDAFGLPNDHMLWYSVLQTISDREKLQYRGADLFAIVTDRVRRTLLFETEKLSREFLFHSQTNVESWRDIRNQRQVISQRMEVERV